MPLLKSLRVVRLLSDAMRAIYMQNKSDNISVYKKEEEEKPNQNTLSASVKSSSGDDCSEQKLHV